jgi:hypothetical protein
MSSELQQFYDELFQEIHAAGDAAGQYIEDTFFDVFCSHLVDAGELDTADRAQYLQRGYRVDGYGGDPAESEGVLSLIIVDFEQSHKIQTLTSTELDSAFSRAEKFLTKALDPAFRRGLEESSPAFGLADLIAARWAATSKVRFFLISNRLLSARVDGRPAGNLEHADLTYSVWDIDRLHRYVNSGGGREPIDIELGDDFGPFIPALPAHLDATYEAYLLVLPGNQLASVYDRYGARLLEQNVRCFLQARGDVNKGIRNTIENCPEMFFAYNNGITATAEAIDVAQSKGSLVVKRIRNLQIVNGGQTTASIHAASRKKDVDLSKIFVQMKLSIIPPEETTEVVPRISEYANSQNRVNAADFFANHPFHVRFEDFSRRIYAPSADGTFRQSKWFYERARGQYEDARSRLTVAQRKKFDLEYPKSQLIQKTDLAKFLNVWRGHPDVVSKGAQKNFAHFAQHVGAEWEKQPDTFNEAYYREAIAKALVFREVERMVSNQPWYDGGYRAQVVAYTIAKLSRMVAEKGRHVDFEMIWKRQAVSKGVIEALTTIAEKVFGVLTNPMTGISNVTEWAKKPGCWQRVMETTIELPASITHELIGGERAREQKKAAVQDQKLLNNVEAQIQVVKLGGDFWRGAQAWGSARKLFSVKEMGILEIAARIPSKLPSEGQCAVLMDVLSKLKAEGFQFEFPVSDAAWE